MFILSLLHLDQFSKKRLVSITPQADYHQRTLTSYFVSMCGMLYISWNEAEVYRGLWSLLSAVTFTTYCHHLYWPLCICGLPNVSSTLRHVQLLCLSGSVLISVINVCP